MEYKNKRFKFFNSTWTIKYIKDPIKSIDTSDEGVIFGITKPAQKEILIALLDDTGKPYSKEHIEETLKHELIHMIFHEGQYNSCYVDEPLVEWVAKSLIELKIKNLL